MTGPLRGAAWGNSGLGATPPNASLTDDQVREIRRRLAAGDSRRAIAAETGASKAAVQAIATGRSYRNVKGTP